MDVSYCIETLDRVEARGVGFSELQSYFSLPFHDFSIVGDVCTVKDKHNRPQYDTVSQILLQKIVYTNFSVKSIISWHFFSFLGSCSLH